MVYKPYSLNLDQKKTWRVKINMMIDVKEKERVILFVHDVRLEDLKEIAKKYDVEIKGEIGTKLRWVNIQILKAEITLITHGNGD